jgi:signal transduction histidine kinase
MFRRVRLRLAVLYAVFVALTVVLLGAAVYFAARESLDRDIRNSIRETQARLNEETPEQLRNSLGLGLQSPGDQALSTDDSEEDDDEDEGLGLPADVFIITTDSVGNVVANPRRVDLEEVDFRPHARQPSTHLHDIKGDEGRFRFLSMNLPPGDGIEEGLVVHVGRTLHARDEHLEQLRRILLYGGLGALALSLLGGVFLSGRALIPIRVAVERQRQFVSDASHELRTPLAVIKANNELLLRHPEEPVRNYLDIVEAVDAETDQMSRLVGDLLTLARSDEGKLDIRRSEVDLGDMLDGLAGEVRPLFASKGLQFTWNVEPAVVQADAVRLRQAVMVLLDNALAYTQPGGQVELGSRTRSGDVEIFVRDDGPGIDPAEQRQVFERFYRLEKSRTRRAGGAGLGLSIAQRIVELHGGKVVLESRPAQGSTFTIQLPQNTAPAS